jgi:hypothetical protein
MIWLAITDAFPRNLCPRCERGMLYVRSSRRSGAHWQLQYLWCTTCPATFKSRVERCRLKRKSKVV